MPLFNEFFVQILRFRFLGVEDVGDYLVEGTCGVRLGLGSGGGGGGG